MRALLLILSLWVTPAVAQQCGYWVHMPDGSVLYCDCIGTQVVCY